MEKEKEHSDQKRRKWRTRRKKWGGRPGKRLIQGQKGSTIKGEPKGHKEMFTDTPVLVCRGNTCHPTTPQLPSPAEPRVRPGGPGHCQAKSRPKVLRAPSAPPLLASDVTRRHAPPGVPSKPERESRGRALRLAPTPTPASTDLEVQRLYARARSWVSYWRPGSPGRGAILVLAPALTLPGAPDLAWRSPALVTLEAAFRPTAPSIRVARARRLRAADTN